MTGAGDTAQVSENVIHTGRDTLAVSTADGVETVDQDRVRISGVPVVGQLFHSRYSLDDLQERKRVGTAYLSGDRLFVDLDRRERFQPVTSVLVLTQNNAHELQATHRTRQDPHLPRGPPAGRPPPQDGAT